MDCNNRPRAQQRVVIRRAKNDRQIAAGFLLWSRRQQIGCCPCVLLTSIRIHANSERYNYEEQNWHSIHAFQCLLKEVVECHECQLFSVWCTILSIESIYNKTSSKMQNETKNNDSVSLESSVHSSRHESDKQSLDPKATGSTAENSLIPYGEPGPTVTSQEPYPWHIIFILGNEFCERFSYYGMKSEFALNRPPIT